jgi:glycosyltransferase involved in cell wall biosynthesis
VSKVVLPDESAAAAQVSLVIPERIRVLTLIESNTVTGPSRVLLDFASQEGSAEPGLPAVDVTVLTFRRGAGESALAAAAERAGVPVIVIPERKRWDWRVIPQMRRAVSEFRPDILESRNVKSHLFIRATGLHKQFPWVAWNHGYTSKGRLDRAYNHIDRWSLGGAFRVMTVCQPFAAAIRRLGVPKEKISILHNFVKPYVAPSTEEVQRLRESLKLHDERVLLTVGRMSLEKGHTYLVDALGLLQRSPELPKTRLLLVGDGPEQENLRRQAERLDVADNITMTGFERNVAPYYALADIFVLPSLSEGSPNVVLEAMSAGLPIAATTVGGVPEILENDKTGLLMPPASPDAMAAALRTLLMDEDLRHRLGSEARREVESSYTYQNYKRSLTKFYVETLEMSQKHGLGRAAQRG